MTFTLKERCVRRLAGMRDTRMGFESDAKQIARFAQPARSRWLASDANKGRQSNNGLNNSHGIFAFRTLQNGMASGLTSPSRPWMTLGSFDDAMMDDAEVKQYWSDTERLMYAFLAQTNFYQATKTGYLEMGLFGTEACIMLPHPAEGLVCHQLTFGEYWLGAGTALTAEALYRECPKTVKTAVDDFGTKNLDPVIVAMYDRGDYDKHVTFFHAIEPNDERDPERMDFRGKPWRSVYWSEADASHDRFIQKQGFEEQPFWAPRWDTTSSDVWGQGPGHDALPDLRELQLQAKRKAEATDMAIWPEKVVSSKIKLKNQPKSIVSAAEVDITKLVYIPHIVDYQTIGTIREDLNATRDAVYVATYADLFMAITNMQGGNYKNIEEIAARNEEKLTQLGPVIERVNNEKLEVAIERVFGIMERAGLLPPAPEALREQPDIKIDFVSILTTMQRMVGLGQNERGVGFVGGLTGMFPEARHKLNVFELIDDYWSRAGAPPKGLRTNEEAEGLADEEAQNAQAAQMAEMAGKAAPAASVAIDAARLMSETPDMAPPAVEDLVPLLPR